MAGLSIFFLALTLTMLLGGCGSTLPSEEKIGLDFTADLPPSPETADRNRGEPVPVARNAARAPGANTGKRPPSELYPGTGVFINTRALTAPPRSRLQANEANLNFQAADIREVVAFILGDILRVNYLIDPKVEGTVTLQAVQPVDSDAVLAILEEVLKMNGAALVREPDLYRIIPVDMAAAESPTLVSGMDTVGSGYRTMVVQLKYIAAEEMRKILAPVVPGDGVLRADSSRNFLILAGTSTDIETMLELVELFDVDWLRGMSVGLVNVRYSEIESIAEELAAIIGDDSEGPLAGMLRIVPIARLNALLVITPQPRYLDKVRRWIERLDRPGDGEGRQLFVYRVENGRAEDLAAILNQLFTEEGTRETAQASPRVAPGLEPAKIRSSRSMADVRAASTSPQGQPSSAPLDKLETASAMAGPGSAQSLKGLSADVGSIRIIAETANNALVILATPADYAKIEAAVQRLDVIPLQVLVEVAIYDVLLSGDLAYGVRWFFNHNLGDGTGVGEVGAPLSFSSTFNYTWLSPTGGIRALIRLLASEDKVSVISAPSLMVLDNQSATIRVGDQVPVPTDTFSSTGDLISSSVSFKDTGVTLQVTPRVNSGGLITMDISQDVTNVGELDEATGETSFFQRSIQSSVAVQSGQTLVLGGLISQRASKAKSGVPGLYKLPIIGNLFGQTVNDTARNELLVFITPRAVRSREEARLITQEFRGRLERLDLLESGDQAQEDNRPPLVPNQEGAVPSGREPMKL